MAIAGNVIARVGADTRGFTRGLRGAQRSLNTWQRGMNRSLNVGKLAMRTAALAITASMGVMAKNSIKMAMTFESSMQQINRLMGNNAGQFTDWANANANAFGMSRTEAVKYGATFGNLIAVISNDTAFVTKRTQQLLKASAVVASATGRTIEDTMQRIRSGLLGNTEAIEDLGINVNIKMIEATDAFRKFAGDKSWSQLDFQVQSQIRLMAILEQAQKKYGDEVRQNTSTSLARLLAILKDVSLNIGNAFLPILDITLPILANLATRLKQVTAIIAEFSQTLFGSSKKQIDSSKTAMDAAKAQSSLGKATKKAGAEAKKGVAGFDEVNQLQQKMSSDAEDAESNIVGGATMGDITGTGGFISDDAKVKLQEFANTIKEIMSPSLLELKNNFILLGEAISIFWSSIEPVLTPILNFLGAIATSTINLVISAVNLSLNILKDSLTLISAILNGDWNLAWETTKNLISSVFEPFIIVKNYILDIKDAISTLINDGISLLQYWINDLKDNFKNLDERMQIAIKTIAIVLTPAILKLATTIALNLVKSIAAAIAKVVIFTAKLVFNALVITTKAIVALVSYIAQSWKMVAALIANTLRIGLATIAIAAHGIALGVSAIAQGVMTAATIIWNGVCVIATAVTTAFGIAVGILTSPIGLVVLAIAGLVAIGILLYKNWDTIKAKSVEIWGSITDVISSAIEGITGTIRKMIDWITKAIDKINIFKRKSSETENVTIKPISAIPGPFNIPKLARGGIVSSPTLSMVGESGTEAVVPLENTSFIDTLAGAIGNAVLTAMQFNQTDAQSDNDLVLNIDSTEIARVMLPAINKENSRIGNTIIQGI